MKLSADLKDLRDTVAHAAHVVPTRPVVPVLACIKLTLTDGLLDASAFDFESAASATMRVDAGTDGQLIVPGRALLDMLGRLPAGTVDVVADDRTLTLTAGRARATLPLMPIADYPALPALPSLVGEVDGAALVRALKHCAEAASTDRANLAGVNLSTEGDVLRVVATDGYRMHTFALPWTGGELGLTVPTAALKAAQAATGTVALHADDSTMAVVSAARTTITRILARPYIRWQQLLFAPSHTMTVDTDALGEALQRAALVCQKGEPVRFDLDGNTLTLHAGQHDATRTIEDLEVDYDGPQFCTAYNPHYLHAALAPVESGRVSLGFTAVTKPALVTDPSMPDYHGIVMPVRLTK